MPAMWAGLAASVVGGVMQSNSASKAAKQQQQAGEQSLALQQQMYKQARRDLAPYRTTGSAANSRLSFLLGLEGGDNPDIAKASSALKAAEKNYNALLQGSANTSTPNIIYHQQQGGDADGEWEWMSGPGSQTTYDKSALASAKADVDAARKALEAANAAPWETPDEFGSLMDKFTGQDLYDDPGYQFRLNEGMKGMENSAAAKGMQLSGANLKGLQRYGQDYASNEFGLARNRFMGDQDQTYNYLTGVTNRGANAASASAGVAQNFGNAGANTYSGMGNAASAGTIASGNALQSGINGAYNAYQDSQQSQRLNALLRNGTGSTSWYNPSNSGFQGW